MEKLQGKPGAVRTKEETKGKDPEKETRLSR